ncbi:hypothetical protein KC957_00580, partial [Candidatus Saccharibacteria bacterium]|nr:hypothetical protein [Candidatus Saccharibacteria bacterium]
IDEDEVIETELTKAARRSVENADQILEADEFTEADFVPAPVAREDQRNKHDKIKKARKVERQRKSKAKKRRK